MAKKHTKINCWEFMACGREPGGSKVHELGICPAAIAKNCDGIHGGVNGGRACWAISGTLCDGKLQGTIASKFKNCLRCRFYQAVVRECSGNPNFLSAEQIIAIDQPLAADLHASPPEEARPFVALIAAVPPPQAVDLRPFLERHACQVLEAQSPEEAVELTASRRPDLILLPLAPAEQEDFATYTLLRRLEHGREVPIILIAPNPSLTLSSQGFKLGALDVIAVGGAKFWTELALNVGGLVEAKRRTGGLRALVIGTGEPSQRVVSACLRQQGVVVVEAKNLAKAKVMLPKQAAIDLVIAEVGDAGDDGVALCRGLRAMPRLAEAPIILLCPEGLRHKGLDLFQAGATDYILTPCPREELLARLLIHIEARQALRNLSQESRKNAMILDSAGEGIIGLDPHGLITFANQAAARLLGYLPEELKGKNLHGLTHYTTVQGMPRSPLDCPIHKALTLGEVVAVSDDIFWRSDNSTLPVTYMATPILTSDGIAGAVLTFRDISSDKREEAMRQDMERMTRHDLKTPLNGIISIPDLLLADDNLTDRQRRCLELLKGAGHRMLRMINESLDMHKMEMKTYELNPTTVDLVPVIRSILGELASALDLKGLVVRVTVDGEPCEPGQQFQVCGEKLLCYSILENLIKNAIEASPEHGQLGIGLFHNGHQARLVIHNQGEVPPEIQERFFDKYSTAGKVGGTGLGTYSAKLMTETQHGSLAMNSLPGQGTSLLLMLPASACPEHD